jgi:hypothetical protein
MIYKNRLSRVVLCAAMFLLMAGTAFMAGLSPVQSPPFNQCPAIGNSPSCGLLIVFNANGTTSILGDANIGPFDGIEDTLVGVQNNSGRTVNNVQLASNLPIFGFDGDGICASFITPHPGACPFGPTGYEGPNTSFSVVDLFHGTVNFTNGGLPPGGSTYFGLEERVTAASIMLPPNITSCAANLTLSADAHCQAVIPDLTAQVVATSVPPGHSLTITQSPPAGTTVGLGATVVTFTVTDNVTLLSSTCMATVQVVDNTPPTVACRVAQSSLWPANHNLVNVGLTFSATDNCSSPPLVQVMVFGDEDDETATGDGNHAPDAKNIAANTLRLRSERKGDSDGRVYLIVIKATDSSGNVGTCCSTVVVPHDQSGASIASANAQAAAAQAFCQSHGGAPPPGFFVIGDGPVIGPKQ